MITKSNILRHDWKKIESSKFISDFNQINWEQILCNQENDVSVSMNINSYYQNLIVY